MNHSLSSLLYLSIFVMLALTAKGQPHQLKCEYIVNPVGIDQATPGISWQTGLEGYGARQNSYHVVAASSPEKLKRPDLWDSGRIESSANTHVPYAGQALSSSQRVWWRVRIWDEDGEPSPWSEPAFFETALLQQEDWEPSQWIGGAQDIHAPEYVPTELMGDWIAAPGDAPVMEFFTIVELPDVPVVSARAYWGTSRKVDCAVFVETPKFPKRHERIVRAQGQGKGGEIDMAFYLTPGAKNRIGLIFNEPTSEIVATAGVRIVMADGEELILSSSSDWQVEYPDSNGNYGQAKSVSAYGEAPHGKAEIHDRPRSLPAIWLRKNVEVGSGLERARLYICALGQGEVYINGHRKTDGYMPTPQSDYDAFAYYHTIDATKTLHEGGNALSVLLDAGWYYKFGLFGHDMIYGRPGMRSLLLLEYSDGRTERIVSDDDWEWSESAILASNTYRGEVVDYRRLGVDWKYPNRGENWSPVSVLEPLSPELRAVEVAPMRATEELKPVRATQLGEQTWLYDLGRVIHGWAKFEGKAPAGATVRVRYNEMGSESGLINVPQSHWTCHRITQGDLYIADGQKRLFQPRFSGKSFRYIEVSGLSEAPGNLVGVHIRTDADTIATFESSDPMLNRLYENSVRTYQNYLRHMFSDLPREQCLWGADTSYSWYMGAYAFDFPANYRLMARLWFTGPINEEAGVPGIIGVGKRGATNLLDFSWSNSPLFLAAKLYYHYGDLSIAREYYGEMKRFLDYFEHNGDSDGLPELHQFTDHAPPFNVPRTAITPKLISGLNYFEALRDFARLADALGKPEDATHARAHSEKIRRGILKYYDSENHTFGNGTQDSLALALGVIEDPAEAEKLAASLAGHYRKNENTFDGGFMSYLIYPMLARYGYEDIAYKMMVNTGYPGPAWSIETHDATTYWERYFKNFDLQINRGLSFIAFAHPGSWMLMDLAGIRFDYDDPGQSKLIIAPTFPESNELQWVHASLRTLQGTAESRWRKEADGRRIRLEVTIPPNTRAEIRLPDAKAQAIEGAKYLKPLSSEDGKTFAALPGFYSFTISP